MDKEFVWTDNTVKEFLVFACDHQPSKVDKFISDYKEYWAYMNKPKPEWEILKVINKLNESVHTPEASCMTNGICSIYSVKRLSDGEVFTVGDIVSVCNLTYHMPIKGFKAQTGAEKVLVCFHNGTDTYLDYIKHAKEEPVSVSLTPTQIEKLHKILNMDEDFFS